MSQTAHVGPANPGPLGLAGAAITTWLFSMLNIGWYGHESVGLVLATCIACGGLAQVIAGIMEFSRGNTFGTTTFVMYGTFWWSLSVFLLFLHDKVPAGFVGWYLFLWGVLSLCLLVCSIRHARAIQLFFVFISLTFLLAAAGDWLESTPLKQAGGYAGLAVSLISFYLLTATILNESFGRDVLPIGAGTAPPGSGIS